MTLTVKGAQNKSLEDALVQEDKLAPVISKKSSAVETAVSAPSIPQVQQPIMLDVSERIVAKISRDGMIESFEIKGSLTLTASNDDNALCSVQMNVGAVDAFTFNTHPKVNKAVYDKSGLIQLKDTTKGFPSARPVGILKWTYASTSDEMIPLKINCWPEEESRGQMNVSIEYSMDLKDMELLGVKIKIPLGTSEAPTILNMDGSHRHSPSAQEMVWELDLIDKSNSTGSLEFTIAQKNADAFFPITVSFESQKLFCNIDVASVTNADGSAPIQYGLQKSMGADEYIIVSRLV
jgi:coatomer subunit delta